MLQAAVESEVADYVERNGVMGLCKPCCSRMATEYKHRRRRRRGGHVTAAEEAGHAEG